MALSLHRSHHAFCEEPQNAKGGAQADQEAKPQHRVATPRLELGSPLITPRESAHSINSRWWRVGKYIKLPGSSSLDLSWLPGSALSMKKLLVGFLLGLAFVELAQSLRCYTCKEPTDISKCKTAVVCSPKATVCTTTLHSVEIGYPFFGNITVTRACEEECLPDNGIGSSKPKSCCYTDLCMDDTKSSSGVRSSSAALTLVAVVAGMVLQCSL
ncbi:PREDICTED: ly6/PLAUR domain-containing protein 2-like [Pseudopodoces humilis]|uniref:ly6/PLAUR domain-containing protein 2-like n=1 Tax=Pseudopodoces humilis TaxID=181119 RepID=UPI0006B7BF9E|nr:PREDICTED: ly6/PLAUR domain-containing protein 2-like [Pseudopodoces humilis]